MAGHGMQSPDSQVGSGRAGGTANQKTPAAICTTWMLCLFPPVYSEQ